MADEDEDTKFVTKVKEQSSNQHIGDDPSNLIQQTASCNAVRNLFMRLRPKKAKTSSPKKKKKSKAEYQADYRLRLKKDPERWAAYCKKQTLHVKRWRDSLNFEQKEEQKEKTRLRCKSKRLKENVAKKSARTGQNQNVPTCPNERTTRAQVAVQEMSVAKKREYWKKKQQLRRANMTVEEKEKVRERARHRYAEKRQKHKEMQTDDLSCFEPNNLNTAFLEESNIDESVLLKSPSKPAKYCALYRTKKCLPPNPKTKVHILTNLLMQCTSPEKAMVAEAVKKSASKRKRKSKTLDQLVESLDVPRSETKKITKRSRMRKDSIVKQTIIKFFISEALHMPGQKFYSKRYKKQKMLLTMPIASLFKKFRTIYPTTLVSKRTFFRCRPGYVMKLKSQKLIQCLCEVCENGKLKLKALKTCGCPISDLKEAISETLCPQSGGWWLPQCVARKCDDCGIHLLQSKFRTWCDSHATVTFKEWRQVFHPKFKINRTELVEETVSVQTLIAAFLTSLKMLANHCFTAEWQRSQFKTLKENLPLDTALIVIDFAENYTCKYQREVSAAHWSYNQVTIHPVVVYHRCIHCSEKQTSYHVFISDDLNHDSNFVFHVLKQVMSQLSSNASKFVIFSDNCSSQYKSKLPFHHMSQLANSFTFERCYFGERHGKNECDSCGGMVKTFLSQAVTSGRVVIRNAEEAVHYLSSQLSLENVDCSHNIRSFSLVQESNIDRSLSSSSLKTVPGTKKIHSFKVLSSDVLATRQFSCFCEFCLKGETDFCLNKNFIGAFTKIKWPNAMHEKQESVQNTSKSSGSRITVAADSYLAVVFTPDNDVAVVENIIEEVVEKVVQESFEEDVEKAFEDSGEDFVENTADIVIEIATDNNERMATDINLEEAAEGREANDADCDKKMISVTALEETVEGSTGTVCYDFVEEGGAISYPVRRALFGSVIYNRNLFFKNVYDQFLTCSSFLELHTLCRDLSACFSNFEIEINFKQTLKRTEVDTVALQLLPKNRPHGYLPVLTVGDGNCMPRAISRIAFGHESNHVEMRCRIISELCLNMNNYLDEDYVSLGCHLPKEKVLRLLTIMSDCYNGEDASNLSTVKEIFKEETFKARKQSCPLGIWQLMAASNILHSNIVSLYPSKGPHKLQLLFGRGLMPHTNIPAEDRLAYIMWTSQRQMPHEHWVANHVVPLLKAHK